MWIPAPLTLSLVSYGDWLALPAALRFARRGGSNESSDPLPVERSNSQVPSPRRQRQVPCVRVRSLAPPSAPGPLAPRPRGERDRVRGERASLAAVRLAARRLSRQQVAPGIDNLDPSRRLARSAFVRYQHTLRPQKSSRALFQRGDLALPCPCLRAGSSSRSQAK